MIIFVFIAFIQVTFAGDDIKNWIQEPIDKYAVNFRTLNGTHKFGSSTSIYGVDGVIQMIASKADIDWVISGGNSGPYVAVFSPPIFTEEFINPLLDSGKISGMILTMTPDMEPPNNFSFDSTCPNQADGSACTVNPYGNSFLLKEWPVPLVLVDNVAGVKAINDCYTKFNLPLDESQESRPLCSLHMKNHMLAAVNSEVCMRRSDYLIYSVKYCDPMGGQNVVLPVGNFWTPEKKVAIINARLDVASMFESVSPGAMSSVTGIVTLLTTAHILKMLLADEDGTDKMKNAVLFTLMNGEAYDYIGSSRIVYDLGKEFPMSSNVLSMKDISMFVDISQISAQTSLYLHTKNEGAQDSKDFINSFTDLLAKDSIEHELLTMDPNLPTSYQPFAKESSTLPGIVISNYGKEFVNKYYHGLYDTNSNIQYVYRNGSAIDKNYIQNYISVVASSLAVSMYQYLTGKIYTRSIESHAPLVDELLHCFLDTNNCKYMNAVITKDNKNKNEPESLYVGVIRGSEIITRLTGRLLALLASDEVPLPQENCTNSDVLKPYSYFWMNGLSGNGVCISTTLKFTPAMSPAFMITDYNWTSGQYSTWTESTWVDFDLHLFLRPSPGQEYITLAVGIIVIILSFIVVYFLNANNPAPHRLVTVAQI